MRGKLVLFTLAGLTFGFILGFIIANSLNRSEINNLKADVANPTAPEQNSTNETLSQEEIRAKIKEADDDPENLTYQKNLGLALYRYGAIKGDVDVIGEAARLLDRAAKLAPDDLDITVGLGNAWFDNGYIKKDNESLSKARSLYEKALVKKPNDADIRTDLAMTYFLETPPNDRKAIDEFKRSLALDAKNKRALQFVVQSYSRLGDRDNATKYLTILKETDPSNPSIAALSSQITTPTAESK